MEVNDIQENYGSGWIKIFRSIRKHWIWEDANKLKWWIDILLEVNHADKKVNIGYDLYECKMGQSIMSRRSWAKKWNVSKTTVDNFFRLLEKDNMIEIKSLSKTSQITVCNYVIYQQVQSTEKPRKDQRKATPVPKQELQEDKNILFSKFYDEELALAKKIVEEKPDMEYYQNEYKKFIAFIYDFKNRGKKDELGRDMCKPKKALLALSDQMSFNEFGEVFDKSRQLKVNLYETLDKMNNHKSMKKNTSFYRTTLTWIKPKSYD